MKVGVGGALFIWSDNDLWTSHIQARCAPEEVPWWCAPSPALG